MAIKILFTADNHLGITYSSFLKGKNELVKERMSSLKYMVDYANANQMNYFIIGGDLFDKTTVADKTIKEVVQILNSFSGDHVLIIPGNHDFFEPGEHTLWGKFCNWSNRDKIIFLNQYEPFEQQIQDKTIQFYPAGCRSLHSEENMIGWVLGHEKNPSHIHIGIAHGNVSGLGLDHHDQYFNMTPAELAHCNLDFWLLGHIHVPFPQQEQVSQNPGIFMAGTHMPDSWKYKHAGNAWHIEIDENKKLQAKRVKPTEIRIDEITQIVNNGLELEALGRLLNNDYKIEKTALRLNLNGRADIEIQQALNKLLADLEPQFLELKVQNNVTRKIDAQLINTTFPNNSLPHVLLSELLEENPTGDSVELAFQILEKVTKEK